MIIIKPKFIFKPKKNFTYIFIIFRTFFIVKFSENKAKTIIKIITRFKIETKPKIKVKIKANLSNLLEFIDLNCKNLCKIESNKEL